MIGKKGITTYFAGYYAGQGRGGRNERTRRLLASKYHSDPVARETIINEMVGTARGLQYDAVTYVADRDSGTHHARTLARLFAARVGRPIIAPSAYRKHDLRAVRILIIDDVYRTGRSMRKAALKLIPHVPLKVTGLAYLAAKKAAGTQIA